MKVLFIALIGGASAFITPAIDPRSAQGSARGNARGPMPKMAISVQAAGSPILSVLERARTAPIQLAVVGHLMRYRVALVAFAIGCLFGQLLNRLRLTGSTVQASSTSFAPKRETVSKKDKEDAGPIWSFAEAVAKATADAVASTATAAFDLTADTVDSSAVTATTSYLTPSLEMNGQDRTNLLQAAAEMKDVIGEQLAVIKKLKEKLDAAETQVKQLEDQLAASSSVPAPVSRFFDSISEAVKGN